MTGAILLGVALDPATAIGRILTEDGSSRSVGESGLATALVELRGAGGVVLGAATTDPVTACRMALGAGRSVLIEAVGRLTPSDVDLLAATGTNEAVVYAGYRRRFEPDVRWSRGSVAGGSLGLPWAVHAEVLSSHAPDASTEALDLLDAISLVGGVTPIALRRIDRGRGAPLVMSLTFDHGAIGQVVVRIASGSEEGKGPELAAFRILGSHGSVLGDLDTPLLEHYQNGVATTERVGLSGAQRLIATFRAAVEGTPGPRPALIGTARHPVELLARSSRRGGR